MTNVPVGKDAAQLEIQYSGKHDVIAIWKTRCGGAAKHENSVAILRFLFEKQILGRRGFGLLSEKITFAEIWITHPIVGNLLFRPGDEQIEGAAIAKQAQKKFQDKDEQ